MSILLLTILEKPRKIIISDVAEKVISSQEDFFSFSKKNRRVLQIPFSNSICDRTIQPIAKQLTKTKLSFISETKNNKK